MDQVLDGLERTSGHLATTLNLPPFDIPTLRREWSRLQEEVRGIPPRSVPGMERVERVWNRMKQTAREQGRPVFVVSSLMAVSTVAHVPANVVWLSRAARSVTRRTGKVLGEAILDHYTDVLTDVQTTGFIEYWRREFRPYLRAAAEQFVPEHESLTEKLLRRRE